MPIQNLHLDCEKKMIFDFFVQMKGIYFDYEVLLEQLASDVKLSTNINDLIPITIYSRLDVVQTNNSSNDYLRFLFYQLFIQQYCLNSSSTFNKNDCFDLVQDYYSSNRKELKMIHEFDSEYTSKYAFTWFMKECFIRRMLTQSLLTLNIQVLFSLRFFIKDMFQIMADKGLTSFSKQNIYSNGFGRYNNGRLTNEQIFYRGQALSKDTFLKIKSNIGKIYA